MLAPPLTASVRPLDLVVLADVRLGNSRCRAGALRDYLQGIRPEVLVINGDLIDRTGADNPLPPVHGAVLRTLLQLSTAGTRIYHLTTADAEPLHPPFSFSTTNFHPRKELVLQIGGRRYWFLPGPGIASPPVRQPITRKLRHLFGWWCRTLKLRGNQSAEYRKFTSPAAMRNTKEDVLTIARTAGYDGVVCGCADRPVLQPIGTTAPAYLNPGTWNRHLGSLEVKDGEWSLHQHVPITSITFPPVGIARLTKPATRSETG